MPSTLSAAPVRQLSRHITADGRQSLMKLAAMNIIGPKYQQPLREAKMATRRGFLPLMATLGATITAGAFMGQRQLAQNPDVQVNKAVRKSTLPKQEAKARRFVTHRDSMRKLSTVTGTVPDKVAPNSEAASN